MGGRPSSGSTRGPGSERSRRRRREGPRVPSRGQLGRGTSPTMWPSAAAEEGVEVLGKPPPPALRGARADRVGDAIGWEVLCSDSGSGLVLAGVFARGGGSGSPGVQRVRGAQPEHRGAELPKSLVVVAGLDLVQDWQLGYVKGLEESGHEVKLLYLEKATIDSTSCQNNDHFHCLMEEMKAFLHS
ncbi:hypothetical protein SASPL_156794 [Salvia splendens]|uniref:Gibberellin receptor GID1 n=1 Tax=Salvia splendens TaxID=180675 RepID=A0A8X8VW22_SALSN|nr:hypothetical protein SASPL_156794 [Salvia splendens]